MAPTAYSAGGELVRSPCVALLFYVSHELTLALLSLQTASWEEAVKAILGAVSQSYDGGNFTLMQEICNIILPRGCDYLREKLDSSDMQSLSAYRSLQAFVAYGRLYNLWWNLPDSLASEHPRLTSEVCGNEQSTLCCQSNCASASNPAEGIHDTEARPEKLFPKRDNNGTSSETDSSTNSSLLKERQALSSCGVLLSEEHAAVQSAQRDISRVQQTLADMIHQHRKNNLQQSTTDEQDLVETQLSLPSLSQNTNEVSEPVSLPDLTKQLTEANQKLAEFPNSIKDLPFPDVLECCLVMLHVGAQWAVDLDPELEEQCLHLLQKYKGTDIYKNACRKFFT